MLDQLAVRGFADEVIAAVKIGAHAIGFGLPLMIALLPASALLAQDAPRVELLATGIAIAIPALASLAVLSAALTANHKGGSAIGGLLVLPLAVPMLIFGAGMLDPSGRGAVKLLAATSLLLTVIGPFATGAALGACANDAAVARAYRARRARLRRGDRLLCRHARVHARR